MIYERDFRKKCDIVWMVTAVDFSIGEQYFIVGVISVFSFCHLRSFISGEIVYDKDSAEMQNIK